MDGETYIYDDGLCSNFIKGTKLAYDKGFKSRDDGLDSFVERPVLALCTIEESVQ